MTLKEKIRDILKPCTQAPDFIDDFDYTKAVAELATLALAQTSLGF